MLGLFLISLFIAIVGVTGQNTINDPITDNIISKSSSSIFQNNVAKVNEPNVRNFKSNYKVGILIDRGPISIDGNADFLSQAGSAGWPGNGTVSNPIIIDNYNITGSIYLIEIKNTDLYFQISNSRISGYGFFGNSNGFGMHLENISNSDFINNQIQDIGDPEGFGDGIVIRDSANLTFNNNNISNIHGGEGFFIDSLSNNIVISNNTITHVSARAMSIGNSDNIEIYNNTIIHNSDGIAFSSSNSIIKFNVIAKNQGTPPAAGNTGIIIGGQNNIITNNTISNGLGFGARIEAGADNNQIIWNDFVGNNPEGTSQASDYDGGSNNTFAFNHWSDWITPDTNSDGLVDQPYLIEGNTNNNDSYPRVSPAYPDTIQPTILEFTIENITYSKNFLWLNYSIDEPSSEVEYSLDNTSNITLLGNTLLTDLFEGYHNLSLTVTDLSGNIASILVFFTIEIPTPQISILSPTNTTYNTLDITLRLLYQLELFLLS